MKNIFEIIPATQAQLLAAFDNTRANAEGWALFNDGELQRLDEMETFQSDTEAYGFVACMAANGSEYHKMALGAVDPQWIKKLIYGA